MNPTVAPRIKIDDCEVCDKKQIPVTLMHGNILMCSECKEKEMQVVTRIKEATQLIDESRKIDSSIQLKQDIYLAKTVPAVELRGAIEANAEIPADQKEYAFAKECMTRFKNLQKVIFEERQALLEKENELRMWQVNVQTAAGKLRAEKRLEFKELDVTYQPTPITTKVKTTKPVKPGTKKFDKTALFEAAKKYNVPAAGVQSLVISKNMSAEDAAKHLHQLMNPS